MTHHTLPAPLFVRACLRACTCVCVCACAGRSGKDMHQSELHSRFPQLQAEAMAMANRHTDLMVRLRQVVVRVVRRLWVRRV